MVGAIVRIEMIFWRWPREFWSGIKYGQNKWQMGPWPCFPHTKKVERDTEAAEKERWPVLGIQEKIHYPNNCTRENI